MLIIQRTFARLLLSALLTGGRHAVSLQGWIISDRAAPHLCTQSRAPYFRGSPAL